MAILTLLAFIAGVLLHVQCETIINEMDQPGSFQCPSNQVIGEMSSQHNNYYEDRKWSVTCKDLPVQDDLVNCIWTAEVNNWDGPMLFICPNNGIITGMSSVHDNYREDRLYKFRCCNAGSRVTRNCATPEYVNDWDAPFTTVADGGKVFNGVLSFHENYYEDRRFMFYICSLS